MSRPDGHHGSPLEQHKRFLGALDDAIESDLGGEVVAVWERSIGRLFVTGGKIAWVTVSSMDRTLKDHLVERAGLGLDDLREVFNECRTTGKNFAETLIEWGLADRATMYEHLLEYGAEGLLEIMSWSEPEPLFIPYPRAYQGTLLFERDELLRRVLELDRGERLTAPTRELLQKRLGLGMEEKARARLDEASSIAPWDLVCQRVSTVSLGIFEGLEEIEGFIAAALIGEDGEPIIIRQGKTKELEGIGWYSLGMITAARVMSRTLGLAPTRLMELDSDDGVILIHPVQLDDDADESEAGPHLVALFRSPINCGLVRVRIRAVARQLAQRMD